MGAINSFPENICFETCATNILFNRSCTYPSTASFCIIIFLIIYMQIWSIMLDTYLLALQLNLASFLSLEPMKNLLFPVYVLPDAKCPHYI